MTTNTTEEDRRAHVARMRASFALEGMHGDPEDLALQEQYIRGEVTLDDMLAYARTFATRQQATPRP